MMVMIVIMRRMMVMMMVMAILIIHDDDSCNGCRLPANSEAICYFIIWETIHNNDGVMRTYYVKEEAQHHRRTMTK